VAAWGNDLAAAYMNREMIQEVGQDPEAALADWGLGRDLRATLLAAQGDDAEHSRGFWTGERSTPSRL
jgi:hypothetical protein